MSGGDNATKTTSNDSRSENKADNEKTEFKVSETASFDDKTITVTKVQRNYDTGNQFALPESDKESVIVTVKITNDSDSTLDYNTYEFKMQDSDGVQQNEAITTISEGKLNSGSLAADGEVTSKLEYEVPKDDKGLKFLYQSLVSSIARQSHSICSNICLTGKNPATTGGFSLLYGAL